MEAPRDSDPTKIGRSGGGGRNKFLLKFRVVFFVVVFVFNDAFPYPDTTEGITHSLALSPNSLIFHDSTPASLSLLVRVVGRGYCGTFQNSSWQVSSHLPRIPPLSVAPLLFQLPTCFCTFCSASLLQALAGRAAVASGVRGPRMAAHAHKPHGSPLLGSRQGHDVYAQGEPLSLQYRIPPARTQHVLGFRPFPLYSKILLFYPSEPWTAH